VAEIAATMRNKGLLTILVLWFVLVALTLVYRSFCAMRIPVDKPAANQLQATDPRARHLRPQCSPTVEMRG